MKAFETDYLENAAPEQREAYLLLRADHLRKMRSLVLIWLTVAIGLIILLGRLADSYSVAAFVIWLLSAVSLMIMTDLGKKRFMQRIRKTPDLIPSHLDPQTAAAWQNADQSYLSEQTALRRERSALLLGSFFVFPLMPVFLIIGIVRARTAKCSPASPSAMLGDLAERINRTVTGISVLGIILCAVLFLFTSMAEFVGLSHVSAMNHNAKALSSAFENFRVDLDMQNEDTSFYGTYIFNSSCKDDKLYAGISQYFIDAERINFALRFDQDGSISEVWCSYLQHSLTEAELVPQSFDTQKEIAGSLFRRRDLIGYYHK